MLALVGWLTTAVVPACESRCGAVSTHARTSAEKLASARERPFRVVP